MINFIQLIRIKKILRNVKSKEKLALFFTERMYSIKFQEKLIIMIFRIISFIGFSERLIQFLKLFTNYYLSSNIKKFEKIMLSTKDKNLNIITFFGEILQMNNKSFICGRFISNLNTIFIKIKFDTYSVNWIRFALIFKKKKLLNVLNCKINNLKVFKRSKNKFILHIIDKHIFFDKSKYYHRECNRIIYKKKTNCLILKKTYFFLENQKV